MLLFLFYFVVIMIKKHSIKIIRYENQLKNNWNCFVNEAKNGCFLFQRDFMEYHSDRFSDFSLMFFLDDELVALLPACKIDTVCYSHKGLTYGSLIVKKECKFALYKDIFTALLDFLKDQNFTELIIKTIPLIYCEAGNDELTFLHQFYEGSVEMNIGSVIYNRKEIALSKSVVRNAKNAVKKGIEIKKSNDFKIFWNDLLLPRLEERFNKKPIHSLDEIMYLKERFPDEIELYAAFLNNEMIAGTILFNNKNFVKSQYIASKSSYNKLGGLDLLHCEIIQNLKTDYFDFGTSSQDHSTIENSSLLAWKEQFGARTIVFPTYTFNIN